MQSKRDISDDPKIRKLIDIADPPYTGRGPKPCHILQEFSHLCYLEAEDERTVTHVRCVGCKEAWRTPARNKARLLAHGALCKGLESSLRQRIAKELGERAPGKLAEDALEGPEAKKRKIEDVGNSEELNGGVTCHQPSVQHISKVEGRKQLEILANAAVVNLFCAGGLSDKLADSPHWKHLLHILNPKYNPVSSTTL